MILEALPYGAILVFAPGPGKSVVKTFSYFDFTPFGYANFAPLITAILTLTTFVFSAVAAIRRNAKIKLIAFISSAAATALSLVTVVSGAVSTVIGVFVTICLAAESALILFIKVG